MRRHESQPAFPRAPSVHCTVVINRIKLLLMMAVVLNAYSWEADSNKCNEELIPIAAKLWQGEHTGHNFISKIGLFSVFYYLR